MKGVCEARDVRNRGGGTYMSLSSIHKLGPGFLRLSQTLLQFLHLSEQNMGIGVRLWQDILVESDTAVTVENKCK